MDNMPPGYYEYLTSGEAYLEEYERALEKATTRLREEGPEGETGWTQKGDGHWVEFGYRFTFVSDSGAEFSATGFTRRNPEDY